MKALSTLQANFLVYDIEMTGLDPENDEIVEIATIPMYGPKIKEDMGFFVQINPQSSISTEARSIHGISGDALDFAGRPLLETVLPQFIDQARGKILIGQKPRLDLDFIREAGKKHAVMIPRFRILDISRIFLYLFPHADRYNLDEIAINMGLRRREGHHNAFDDALLTAKIFSKMIARLSKKGILDVESLKRIGRLF